MTRILIIDDDELTRLGLTHALQLAGFEAEAVGDVREALERLRESEFHGVLLDIEMSPVDGVTCLTAIRADKHLKNLPVIMMSGLPQRGIVMRVARLGARGLVLKNASFIKELVRRVQDLAKGEPAMPHRASTAGPVGATSAGRESAPAARECAPPAAGAAPSTPARPAAIEGVPEPEPTRLTIAAGAAAAGATGAAASPADALAALKSLKPIIGRQELLDRVLSGNELRVMGPAARQVLSLAGSESASVDAVARAIKQDQAMSLRILKLANSPLYRRGAPMDSVGKAVARIGTAQIRQTILAMSVMDQFHGAGIEGRLRADQFWEHSIFTGLLASGLARARGCAGEQADALFTAGLLHDVGRMLFVERLGDIYAGVLDVAEQLRLPLEAVESRLLLLNHADLTDRLLREWTFPADMVAPIAYHHLSVGNIRSIAPRSLPDAATLALANRLAHCMGVGSSGNDVLYPTEEFVTALNLKPAAVAAVCAEAGEHFGDLRATMLIHASDGPAADKGGASRRPPLSGVRAACVAREPAINPAEHALRKLGVLASIEPPNVLVLRVTAPGERVWAVEQARAARAEHGPLPILVLATSQACFLEPQLFEGAPIEQHVLPLQMERLEFALSSLAQAHAGAPKVARAA